MRSSIYCLRGEFLKVRYYMKNIILQNFAEQRLKLNMNHSITVIGIILSIETFKAS